jgi:archaellum biogenesis protein FlaJ (TadC family)
MTITLYITCFIVAMIGMLLQTVLKIKSLQDKARAANVTFNPSTYFKNDWLSIVASILTIVMFLFFIDYILKWRPGAVDYLKILFAFVGYTGSDIASKLFGVISKKINTAIDEKTTISDGTAPPNKV